MVSSQSLVAMLVSFLVCVGMPVILALWFVRRQRGSWYPVLIGVVVFVVFQLLTRIPLLGILSEQPFYKAIALNTLLNAFFLGSTAGIFEEGGRFLAFRYLMQNRLGWRDGVSYGIGHGGAEAMLLVGMTMLNNIIVSLLINMGMFESAFGSQLTPEMASVIRQQLVETPSYMYLVGAGERILTMPIQIGLSLVVMLGFVKNKPLLFLLAAILLHTVVDMPAVLLAKNIGLAELWVAFCAAAALIFIFKSRGWFAAARA